VRRQRIERSRYPSNSSLGNAERHKAVNRQVARSPPAPARQDVDSEPTHQPAALAKRSSTSSRRCRCAWQANPIRRGHHAAQITQLPAYRWQLWPDGSTASNSAPAAKKSFANGVQNHLRSYRTNAHRSPAICDGSDCRRGSRAGWIAASDESDREIRVCCRRPALGWPGLGNTLLARILEVGASASQRRGEGEHRLGRTASDCRTFCSGADRHIGSGDRATPHANWRELLRRPRHRSHRHRDRRAWTLIGRTDTDCCASSSSVRSSSSARSGAASALPRRNRTE